jgi:nitrile hydratase
MSRVHDMGGRFGDGAVTPEDEDVKFHADWHPRALAVTLASGSLGQWTLDESRHARETVAPKEYARFSYYEKWMAGLANLLVRKGVVTPEGNWLVKFRVPEAPWQSGG